MTKSVSHLAWLHSTPKPKEKDDGKPKPKSRMETYRDTIAEKLPHVAYCDYLFDLLSKMGVCGSGMAGAAPLSWGQVNDWCVGNGLELYPTERRAIIELSNAYVSQLHKSEDPNELPPASIGEDGEPDYGYLGQLHMGSRDKRRKERAAK